MTEAALDSSRPAPGRDGAGPLPAVAKLLAERAEEVATIVASAKREGTPPIAGVLFQAALRRSEAAALE